MFPCLLVCTCVFAGERIPLFTGFLYRSVKFAGEHVPLFPGVCVAAEQNGSVRGVWLPDSAHAGWTVNHLSVYLRPLQ